jgi:hypothetical protein
MHAEMPDIPRSAPELNFAPQFVDLIPINISEPCNFDAGTFAEESSGCCRQQLSPNYEERSSPPWWNTALSNSQPVDPSPVPSAHPSDESAHTPGPGVMRRSFEDSEPTFALQPSSPACMASAVDEMMRCRVQQFAETNQQCDARHGVHGPKSVCAFPVLSKGQEQTLSHAQTFRISHSHQLSPINGTSTSGPEGNIYSESALSGHGGLRPTFCKPDSLGPWPQTREILFLANSDVSNKVNGTAASGGSKGRGRRRDGFSGCESILDNGCDGDDMEADSTAAGTKRGVRQVRA